MPKRVELDDFTVAHLEYLEGLIASCQDATLRALLKRDRRDTIKFADYDRRMREYRLSNPDATDG